MLHKYLERVLLAQNWLKKPGIIVRETQIIPSVTRRKLIASKGACCKHCGRLTDLTVDHAVARSLGGTNDKSNIQVLCLACNREKNLWEMDVLRLLRTEDGRAELLYRLRVNRELDALKGRIKTAQRKASAQLAYRIVHGLPS